MRQILCGMQYELSTSVTLCLRPRCIALTYPFLRFRSLSLDHALLLDKK